MPRPEFLDLRRRSLRTLDSSTGSVRLAVGVIPLKDWDRARIQCPEIHAWTYRSLESAKFIADVPTRLPKLKPTTFRTADRSINTILTGIERSDGFHDYPTAGYAGRRRPCRAAQDQKSTPSMSALSEAEEPLSSV